MTSRKTITMVAAAVSLYASGVSAQGVPVIDNSAIAKHIESIAQLAKQLETMKAQLDQAQQLYGSLNKLTDMADIATVLNDPAIRKALPQNFTAIEGLLKGATADAYGGSATKFLNDNSLYQTNANDFYASELARTQTRNAGQMSLGQHIYDAATKRIGGIDQLRERISQAGSAKEIADLQARLLAETAFLETDALRMQALRMIQQAQVQVDQQRQAEDWRKRLDTMGAALK
ncbi:type IV secretion system protein VirB5 [Ensifer adhaerens]|uniref:Type IV secretion system protein VirB5 n=1 Tax=Ensifer adhaerens TaxID=106592 RepID=A0ACC5T6Q5_ENSAD|nr:P-type DNA transfer protein VirB5 [Ensifer adhaerens]MBP1876649.1 type IV secretion system protein VirB5 [Ensifer adhaerens]